MRWRIRVRHQKKKHFLSSVIRYILNTYTFYKIIYIYLYNTVQNNLVSPSVNGVASFCHYCFQMYSMTWDAEWIVRYVLKMAETSKRLVQVKQLALVKKDGACKFKIIVFIYKTDTKYTRTCKRMVKYKKT